MESTPTPADREPPGDLSPDLESELTANSQNPLVGTRLLLEDARTRVWEIRLAPGERLAFHRHVVDYVWTCVSGGLAISHDAAGKANRVPYEVGETRALSFGKGESMIHDLENIGAQDIVFTTVEFLDSANEPLPLEPAT
jgi:mannose-6-phosphate isomerase-like protein (cupin superfamily)